MARTEEHLRELLKLPAEERARIGRVLLDSLDQEPSFFAEGTETGSDSDVSGSSSGSAEAAADHGESESDELDELIADKAELRAAVRAAVQAELEPLHELTLLLQQLAERASATGRTLRARSA